MKNNFEKCILCGKTTDARKDEPIELRDNYIEGAGQLCPGCMVKVNMVKEEEGNHANRKALTDDILYILSLINPDYDRLAVYKHLSQLTEERLREEFEKTFEIWRKDNGNNKNDNHH